MILNSKETTVIYRCPHCGLSVISVVGIFTLSGDMVKLKCECGNSELVITKTKDAKVRIKIPCLACGDAHTFIISQDAFFERKVLCLACTYTGINICFIGEKEEAQRLCAFCNNTGPAFVIAGVGSLLCDYMLGVAIYIIEVISALILGVILSIGKPRKREYSRRVVKFNPDLTAGVRDALSATLSVCAFVIFFSVLNKCIFSVASPILSSKYFSALFCALLEVTSGVSTGAVLGGRAAFVLCAFAVGWSGLCVHTQTAAFLIPSGLSVKKYIFQKACCGLICTALALLYSLFFIKI